MVCSAIGGYLRRHYRDKAYSDSATHGHQAVNPVREPADYDKIADDLSYLDHLSGAMNFNTRPMRLEDIPQVEEIDREAFPTTWPPTSFKRELGNRLARYLVAWTRWEETGADSLPGSATEPSLVPPRSLIHELMARARSLLGAPPEVAHRGEEFVAGYVGVWFMMDEAHITSIAVRESYRGLGLGELLLMAATELAMARRAQSITLEARVTNWPAHALYEKYGFQKTGSRKGYYADNHEDAVIMSTDSILSSSYQEMFRSRVDAFRQRRGDAIRALA